MKEVKILWTVTVISILLCFKFFSLDDSGREYKVKTKVIQKIVDPTKYGNDYVLLLEREDTHELFDLDVSLATFHIAEIGKYLTFTLNKRDLGKYDKMDDIYGIGGVIAFCFGFVFMIFAIERSINYCKSKPLKSRL